MASTWGSSWGTSWAQHWEAGGAVVPPTTTTAPGGVGRGRGGRKRRLYVEIDGESFPVNDEQEAIALLEQARRLAEEQAAQIAKAAAARPRPKATPPAEPELPKIEVSETLDFGQVADALRRANEQIAQAYRQAYEFELATFYRMEDARVRGQQEVEAREIHDVLGAIDRYEFEILAKLYKRH